MLWRIPALVGGAGGLASLAIPYALVTGDVLGVDVQEEQYTLFGLARLLEDTGNDPQMVYLLVVLVAVGSTMALIGAFASSSVAFGGGIVQGGAAAAFAYGVLAEGSRTFFYGLGQLDMTFETGFYALAVAALVSLSSLPVKVLLDLLLGSGSGT